MKHDITRFKNRLRLLWMLWTHARDGSFHRDRRLKCSFSVSQARAALKGHIDFFGGRRIGMDLSKSVVDASLYVHENGLDAWFLAIYRT